MQEVRKGRWQASPDFAFIDHSIIDVSSMRIGIVGMGNIGQAVAKVAIAFGAEVIAVAKYGHQLMPGIKGCTLEECLALSDVVSLHVPLNEDTKQMINAHTLSLMKRDAVLINTGRGPLIEEDDLTAHLVSVPTFQAILDVLTIEPPTEKLSKLLALPNCHVTPHIAWANKQSRIKLVKSVRDNISAFISGNPINIVS